MMEAYERPYKTVREALIDDWTGHKYARYWEKFGEEYPQPAVAEELDERGFPTGRPFPVAKKAASLA